VSRDPSLPVVLAAALASAEGAVRVLRPRERPAPPVRVEPRAYFSAEELGRARRFRRGQLALLGVRGAVELGLLAATARRPPRSGLPPLAAGAATAAGLTAASTVAALPFRALSRRRAQAVGLVTQGWGGWAADVAKGTAIGAGLSAAGGALLAAGERRFGRDWWLPGAAGGVAFAALATAVGPILLDPVFNRFTPLPDGELRGEVLRLARDAGVEVGEVYEVDASRRTTAANAYVNGLGRTKRVVLFDTLLRDFTPAEVRLVVAHELGHVRHRDVPRGLAWLALAAPLGTLAVARLAERLSADPVIGAALALTLAGPALTAVSARLSRAVELRTDAFALDLTREPDAMVGFQRRITVQNVGDPAPPRWSQALLGTHPTTMERIGLALAHGARA
jgi:Zn-dependent protease with chaperone function